MKNNQTNAKTKGKVKFIVTHGYSEGRSMESAFQEVIEKSVLETFDKIKEENSN
ncbi:MAG: hypothetical protein R3Y63_14070 [Eubacteriales bacterium]